MLKTGIIFILSAVLMCTLNLRGENRYPVYYPLEGTPCVSSHFGYRDGEFHYGLDLWTENILKTVLMSIADGTVVRAGYDIRGGYFILIRHNRLGVESRYFHVDRIYVNSGSKVKRGEVIGTPGDTGRTTGPHLHVEIIDLGTRERVNPYLFFQNYGIYFNNCWD